MSPSLPRDKPAGQIGRKRRGIGETPEASPLSAVPPAPAPAPAPTAAAAVEAPAPKASKAKPAPKGNGRPPGTSRLALDMPEALANDFRARAKKHRFSQNIALSAALVLLERLDDQAYEQLLNQQLDEVGR